jgi:hypothetical protein
MYVYIFYLTQALANTNSKTTQLIKVVIVLLLIVAAITNFIKEVNL